MKKDIYISNVGLQDLVELTQLNSIDTDADSAKLTWHNPKLRVLKVSQETLVASGGAPT